MALERDSRNPGGEGLASFPSDGRARIFSRREEKYELDPATAAWLEDELASRLPLFSYYEGFPWTYITTVYFDTRDHRFYQRAAQDYDDNVKIRVREYYYRTRDGAALRAGSKGTSPIVTEGVCYVELKQRCRGEVTKKRFALEKTALESLLRGDDVWDFLVRANPGSSREVLKDAYDALRGYLVRYAVEVTSVVNYRRKVYQKDECDLRITLDDQVAVYRPFRGLYTVVDALTREQLGAPIRESDRVILEIKSPGEYPGWLVDLLKAFSAQRLSKFTTSVRLLLGDSAAKAANPSAENS